MSDINKLAVEACRALVAWDDSENAGPDYGTLTRDTHPFGEKIWRTWWVAQGNLCELSFAKAREFLAAVDAPEPVGTLDAAMTDVRD